MLGWLQCQLPNIFDYLYLCSLVAITNASFCSLLCFSTWKKCFYIVPNLLHFICVVFNTLRLFQTCHVPRMKSSLRGFFFHRSPKWMLYLYMMATHHCNIQKIKKSEDTWTSPRLVFDEFMQQIKSVTAYEKEKMAVDWLRSAASPMQVSKTGALWIQGYIIKPQKREVKLILWFVLKKSWPVSDTKAINLDIYYLIRAWTMSDYMMWTHCVLQSIGVSYRSTASLFS